MMNVESTSFSFFTAEELRELSVCTISSATMFDDLNQPVSQGLFDPALGAWERNMRCPTCGETDRNCPGHVGHIELAVPVYSPLLFTTLHKLLNIKCFHCHKLLLDELKARYFYARLALIEAGEWKRCDELEAPSKPAGKGNMGEDEAAKRHVISERIEAAIDSVRGRERTIRIHERTARALEIKEFWKGLREAKRCENCGAARRKVRKDGATKLFQVPLELRSVRGNLDRGISAPKSARAASKKAKSRLEADSDADEYDSDDGNDSDEEHDVGKAAGASAEQYLDAMEVREQLKLLWGAHADELDALLGRVGGSDGSEGYRSMILDVIGVPAPRFRPAQRVGAVLAEHPQNSSLVKILQVGDKIRGLGAAEVADRREQLLKLWIELQNEVNIYVDSSKSGNANQPPGIKQLLERKEGLFRKHMMGKRVDFCCRSVISPDPFLGSGEVGLPVKFARGLSYPEAVTPYNVEQLRAMVENGADEWPGANYVELKPGSRSRVDLSRVTSRARRAALAKQLLTTPGQRVGRHVLDGDALLLNRQPTLHKPGIMAHIVKVLSADSLKSHQTLRMHYANCNAYNADFDGDEINCHLPQSELARAEAKTIAACHAQYIVPTDAKPLRGLIQDHIDASVKLTCADSFLEKDVYFQFVYEACRDAMVSECDSIDPNAGGKPAVIKPRVLYTGKQLIACVTATVTRRFAQARRAPAGAARHAYEPKDVLDAFACKSKVAAKAIGGENSNLEENLLEIRNGILVKGIFDKAQFAGNGIVHAVHELYGARAAAALLDAYARLFTLYLRDYGGHTCGMGDLVLSRRAEADRQRILAESHTLGVNALDDFLEKRTKEAEQGLRAGEAHADARTRKMRVILAMDGGGAALDGHMQTAMAPAHSAIVKACLPGGLQVAFPYNNFSLMVTTGAKGSVVNQSQITCALGQQSLEGRRVPLMANGKALPCFAPFDASPRAGGFITDRFLTGIRPQEYYFHCMAGREGLVDTAVKTSRSGYLQRCLVKHLEELSVQYDHTVRDAEGSVVQFLYGDDGLDPIQASMLGGDDKTLRLLANNMRSGGAAAADNVDADVRRAWAAAGLEKIAEGAVVVARRAYDEDGGAAAPARRADLGGGWHAARVLKMRANGTCDVEFFGDGAVVKRCPVELPLEESDGKKKKRRQLYRLYAGEGQACPVIKLAPQESVMSRFWPSKFGVVSDALGASIAKVAETLPTQAAKADLFNAVYAKYGRALAAPGEAVGALAAQSVGEPSTQMTLNTFHLAGHGAGNVTLGIPRLREVIMTASDHIKTPLVVLPLQAGGGEGRALLFATSMNKISLVELLDTKAFMEVRERVAVTETKQLRRVYSCSLTLHKQNKIDAAFGPNLVDEPKVCLQLEMLLRRALMKLNASTKAAPAKAALVQPAKPKKATMKDLVQGDDSDDDDDDDDADAQDDAEQGTLSFGRRREVAGYEDDSEDEVDDAADATADVAAAEATPAAADSDDDSSEDDAADEEDDDVARPASKTPSKASAKAAGKSPASGKKAAAKAKKAATPSKHTVVKVSATTAGGCVVLAVEASVSAAAARAQMAGLVEAACAKAVVREARSVERAVVDATRMVDGAERGAVLVEGRDFEALWSASVQFDDAVDLSALESNDIAGMLKHYGVEAARACIVREISGVFGVYGISVDPRHLSLIADSMTQGGGYKAMNRNSMALASSPYLQMSFETTAQFLTSAALANGTDHLQSPSARIVMGQPTKIGTGLFDIVVPLQPHTR
ncbi:hypothetical protein M885DRAFT_461604 [Pelagophyceae sp. CCMP2097]|nr:hypothetical protein M885DRAFT_461604 [Pelagophyceae sp. CCMP2097]